MKKIGFFCIFIISLHLVFADVIDNMLLDSLYESKREAESNKENVLHKEDSMDTESSDNKTSKQDTKNTAKKQTEKSHKHSPFRINVVNETIKEKDNSYKKIVLFLGIGSEVQTPNTNEDKSALKNIGLQLGAFKYLTQAQAFRFSGIVNYNAMINQDFYSIGGAIDYFYNKRLKGRALSSIGVFAGSVISMPIYNNLYTILNITARIGLFATMTNLHVEAYIGYPFYQDSKLHNILSSGINIHYFFNIE